MIEGFATELQEQGRGMIGALVVVGISFLYTMEAWWLGWQLPVSTLLVYAVLGLGVVLALTRAFGFREEEGEEQQAQLRPSRIAIDFAQLVLQSFLTAYLVWLLFGIIEVGDPPITIARLGLFLIVPLSFGAALANKLFGDGENSDKALQFPQNIVIFALGAVFLSAPMSLTQEMELMAAHAGWWRLAAVIVLSVLTAYLVLYELEFQGQQGRVGNRTRPMMVGVSFIVYLVALVVSASMLWSFGHFSTTPVAVWIQEIVVLGFPATIGASASQVILG